MLQNFRREATKQLTKLRLTNTRTTLPDIKRQQFTNMSESASSNDTPAQQPLAAGANSQQPQGPAQEPAAQLPKLSAKEFATYNSMAEHMDYFHNNFRRTWNLLHDAAVANKRPANMSIGRFLSTGLDFCHHLHVHHSIEEQHIFPVLAKRMPAFRKELELLTQHKQIHKGMDKLEAYLTECRSGERELRLVEVKDIMDGFGEVLWQHLGDEVKQLGAENMRKYWSPEEMRRMPM